jgi:hypothetical protein
MKTVITFLFALVFVSTNLSSQDIQLPLKTNRYQHAIGIGAGFTTGFGISYKHCPDNFGFMVNFGPYTEDYGKVATISAGLTLIKKLNQNEYNNIYAYFSNSYLYSKTKNYNYNFPGNSYTYNKDERWNSGLGLGFEFDSRKRIVMNIMLGYAQYNTFERLFPTVEAALHFRFN